MDRAQGRVEPEQAVFGQDHRRHRVRHRIEHVEGMPDRPGDRPAAHVLVGRVDRDHGAGEVIGRQPVVERTDRAAQLSEQDVLGVYELPLVAEDADLSGEQGPGAGLQLVGPELVAAPEEDQLQGGPAVADGGFDADVQALLAAATELLDAAAQHVGHHRHVVALAQAREVGQLAPLGQPPRVVPHQIADGGPLDLEHRVEGLRGLAADDLGEGSVEGRHCRYSSASRARQSSWASG